MSKCGLLDIDGIASMQNLKELYVAFNNISDVSPISFLESVEVADLEGNKIADVEQLDYLAMLTNLTTLTLSGNPICQQYQTQCKTMCSFRELVLEKMPGLQMFNDEHSLSSESDEFRPSTAASSHSQEDIDIINTAIKEGILKNGDLSVPQYTLPSDTHSQQSNSVLQTTKILSHTRPRPATAGAQRSVSVVSPDSRKLISSPQTRPSSSGSEGGILQDDSSSLTQGDVICGNPIQLLARNRRKVTSPLLKVIDDEKTTLNLHRPLALLGLQRRPLKVGTGSSASVFQDERIKSGASSPEDLVDGSKDLESDRLSPGRRNDSTAPPTTTSSRKIPSPIASGGQPYKTPTPPPRSPQRPQTASDFRAGRYRRSYSSSSSSVNVMSVNAVSSRFRSSEPIRKEIEDLT
uniref:Leucine-rich repeat-containing protein 56-like n=1 Tax=Phallusia mammillata TaxID=59560 RepID=A0A6F9DKT4_9ASCI|nr:leucine-rich repeat-containing protein 56-like [Phallusia mammillata]